MQDMSFLCTELTDRQLLTITGTDARDFLQGLISNDMDNLTAQNPLHALLLTPQGKIMFDFILYQHEQSIWLDVAKQAAPNLVKRLGFYKLRADVSIVPMDEKIFAVWSRTGGEDEGASKGANLSDAGFADPRHVRLGKRFIGAPPALKTQAGTLSNYKAHRLNLLTLEGPDELGDAAVFPLEFRLDERNAIDFQKGCFVGQEVTSRSYRRGSIRKKIFLVHSPQPLENGQDITAQTRRVGQICTIFDDDVADGFSAIALLRCDSLEEVLTSADVPLTVDIPLTKDEK